MATRGKFIVFEGLDGSGKTTQMRLLQQKIEQVSSVRHCVGTFEPTDGPVGSLIRKVLHKDVALEQETIAMLYAADRYQHVAGQMLALINAGTHVVCDRYYYSNYVYQADKVPLDRLMQFNAGAKALLTPDITLFLDTDPGECVRRISGLREDPDLYETYEKLSAVRRAYLDVFDRLKAQENIVIVPSLDSPEATFESVWQLLCRDFFTEDDLS